MLVRDQHLAREVKDGGRRAGLREKFNARVAGLAQLVESVAGAGHSFLPLSRAARPACVPQHALVPYAGCLWSP